jgi:dihydroorotase
MDWSQLVRVMAVAPRACLNLPEVRVEEGGVGDITVVDPEAKVEVVPDWFESNSSNSSFLGHKLLGKASEVVVAGELVTRNGKVVGT